jgi:hypothetical protein
MGMVWVSTIFLGMDHNWGGGRPLLFETMAFWGACGACEQERCSTWLEAEAQHRAMCAYVVTPRAVLAWIVRAWHEYWRRAVTDWKRSWRDQRGIPDSEIERIMRQMDERLSRD